MKVPKFFIEPLRFIGDRGSHFRIVCPEIGFVFGFNMRSPDVNERVNAAVFWHIIGGCGEP